MRRTGFILPLLASASLLVVSSMPEQLWAQATRERVTTEEKVTTTTTTTSPVTLTKEIIVQQAPPPPQQETVVAPPAGQIWVPGTWTWVSNSWQWVSGRPEPLPPQKATWVPGQWVQQGPNWVWRPGHWEYPLRVGEAGSTRAPGSPGFDLQPRHFLLCVAKHPAWRTRWSSMRYLHDRRCPQQEVQHTGSG